MLTRWQSHRETEIDERLSKNEKESDNREETERGRKWRKSMGFVLRAAMQMKPALQQC